MSKHQFIAIFGFLAFILKYGISALKHAFPHLNHVIHKVQKILLIALIIIGCGQAELKSQETYAGVSVMPQAVWLSDVLDLTYPEFGYAVGFNFIRDVSHRWSIEADLQYSSQNGRTICEHFVGPISTSGCYGPSERWHLIQLPVLAHYKLSTKSMFSLLGGFQGNYLLKKPSKLSPRPGHRSFRLYFLMGGAAIIPLTEKISFITQFRLEHNLTNPYLTRKQPHNIKIGILSGAVLKL